MSLGEGRRFWLRRDGGGVWGEGPSGGGGPGGTVEQVTAAGRERDEVPANPQERSGIRKRGGSLSMEDATSWEGWQGGGLGGGEGAVGGGDGPVGKFSPRCAGICPRTTARGKFSLRCAGMCPRTSPELPPGGSSARDARASALELPPEGRSARDVRATALELPPGGSASPVAWRGCPGARPRQGRVAVRLVGFADGACGATLDPSCAPGLVDSRRRGREGEIRLWRDGKGVGLEGGSGPGGADRGLGGGSGPGSGERAAGKLSPRCAGICLPGSANRNFSLRCSRILASSSAFRNYNPRCAWHLPPRFR